MKKRIFSLLLAITCLLGVMPVSAYAANDGSETYLDETADGNIFVQKNQDKIVTIATTDVEHIVSISILYSKDIRSKESCIVYQWVLNDYPDPFSPNIPSFWEDVIEYAEARKSEASLIAFALEETEPDEPMALSSAGADLASDLQSIVGREYSNKYIEMRRMGGHDYRLYETLEYNIRKVHTLSWRDGATAVSIVTSTLGLVATNGTVTLICGVLGILSTASQDYLPAGKMNQYECMALYTRYVTVDYGTRQYGHAYKIRNFEGYEEASNNSTGRAHIIPDTELLYYDSNQSAEYFYGGIFDEAYNAYNNIL